MLASLVTQAMVLIAIVKLEKRMRRRPARRSSSTVSTHSSTRYSDNFNPVEMFWKLIRLQLQQPESFRFRTLAGHVTLVVFALVQCVLIASLYQSWILSALLRAPNENPMSSVNELIPAVKERRYSLVTDAVANWFYENLAVSNASDYRQVYIQGHMG